MHVKHSFMYSVLKNATSLLACLQCDYGRITPGPGTATADGCLSPMPNFVFGSTALFIAAMLIAVYVSHGRFHRVAFLRRERYVCVSVCIYVIRSNYDFSSFMYSGFEFVHIFTHYRVTVLSSIHSL